MLKKILAISGRPGLYRLVNPGKNMLIVEELASGKRLPVGPRDRVSALGDITIYAADGSDKPLPEVMEALSKTVDGKAVDLKQSAEQMRALFAEAFPGYDPERVHNSDIRKILQWLNALHAAGITTFVEEPAEKPAE